MDNGWASALGFKRLRCNSGLPRTLGHWVLSLVTNSRLSLLTHECGVCQTVFWPLRRVFKHTSNFHYFLLFMPIFLTYGLEYIWLELGVPILLTSGWLDWHLYQSLWSWSWKHVCWLQQLQRKGEWIAATSTRQQCTFTVIYMLVEEAATTSCVLCVVSNYFWVRWLAALHYVIHEQTISS